jgi:HD-like signal output (HDOD) protein
MRRSRSELRDAFKRLTNLPTLPDIASRCMRMISDPRASSGDIAALIGQDPSLSSKLLRLANSAFYGMPGKITSINQAVVILGFKVITTIVLSVTVFDMFPESKQSKRLFDRKAFWLHSLGCGLTAKYLAQRLPARTLDPEEAFCAGLLHDIGKVVLEQYLHEEFHAALRTARAKSIPLFAAEKETLGFTHANCAEWLMSDWGLPPEIELPIVGHHDGTAATHAFDGVALCAAADWACYQIGIVIDSAYTAPELEREIADRINLTPETIGELREKIPGDLAQSSIFFGVGGG